MNKIGRRGFIKQSAQLAAVAGLCAVTGQNAYGAAEGAANIGACGLACNTCPLMKAGKCKGCGAGNAMSAEMAAMKKCPVLTCANMKKIAFCGTDCKMYTKCDKLIGRPYAKEFMQRIEAKLG